MFASFGREDQIVRLPPLAQVILQEAIDGSGDLPFVSQTRRIEFGQRRRVASQVFADLRHALGISDQVRGFMTPDLVVSRLAQIGVPCRSHVLWHTADVRKSMESSHYNAYDFLSGKHGAGSMARPAA
jgi:hypothetical protein